jgi:hypothetical protein
MNKFAETLKREREKQNDHWQVCKASWSRTDTLLSVGKRLCYTQI